jgi:hypothetical protein
VALRRNHARARHAIWLSASVKFLVPFSLLVFAGSTTLTQLTGRLVLEQSGLKGSYDFVLAWTPDESQAQRSRAPEIARTPRRLRRSHRVLRSLRQFKSSSVSNWNPQKDLLRSS